MANSKNCNYGRGIIGAFVAFRGKHLTVVFMKEGS